MTLPPAPHSDAHQPSGQAPLTQLPVAQLERRFQAFAIDRLIAWTLPAAAGVLSWLVIGEEVWPVVGAVGATLVVVWLVMAVVLGITGSSPGKAVRGLRVVHHGTGAPIGVGPALLRSLVLGLSGIPTFGIGVATLAWTAVEDPGGQRRGWHDHLASSVVVDVRPAPEVQDAGERDAPRHIVNLTAMRLVPAPPVDVPVPPARTGDNSMRRQPLAPPVPDPPLPPRQAQPSRTTTAQPPTPPQQPAQAPPSRSSQASPAAPAAAGPQGVAMRWRVLFDDGQTFTVEGLVLVGRRPEARAGEPVFRLVPLASADMSVSKTHAQFAPAPDGALVVTDRGSTNGTTLVRQGVSRQLAPGRPATLVDGDTVVFGDRQMVVSREA